MTVTGVSTEGGRSAMLVLCAGILFTFISVQAGELVHGALISRGAGSDAARHDLPDRAIDTDQLPHTRLSAQGDRDAALPLYRLGPDSYFLYGNIATIDDDNRGFNANAGFVVTDAGVLVIDALGTPRLGERLIASIRSVTDQPIRYLVLTHNHPDHAYGASAFRALPDVKIVGHPGMREYTGSETMQRSVDYRRDLLPRDMQGFEAVMPDLYVPGDRFGKLRIELGGKTFDIYNAGSHHSHGDLVVHQVEDRILWVSDLVFNQRVTFIGDGDSRQILAAHDWLLKTFADARLMVPGHGSAQTPPFPMAQQTRAYIEQLRDLMRQKLEADVPLLEAVEQSDMPQWRAIPLYDENQRANAAFIYREMEFEVF
ncbi:MAG: MBL fold metallo-hydrolase [Thiogranum sp.]|nr:MBL fold metallo-hydrolase [Thiogranum sp.]